MSEIVQPKPHLPDGELRPAWRAAVLTYRDNMRVTRHPSPAYEAALAAFRENRLDTPEHSRDLALGGFAVGQPCACFLGCRVRRNRHLARHVCHLLRHRSDLVAVVLPCFAPEICIRSYDLIWSSGSCEALKKGDIFVQAATDESLPLSGNTAEFSDCLGVSCCGQK